MGEFPLIPNKVHIIFLRITGRIIYCHIEIGNWTYISFVEFNVADLQF